MSCPLSLSPRSRPMIRPLHFLHLLILLALSIGLASAQVPTGTPPFGSFGGGPDVINLADLNSHISIPIVHRSGRGTDFVYNLDYESSVWYPVTSGSTTSWQPANNWGWNAQTAVGTGFISDTLTYINCYDSHHVFLGVNVKISNLVYHDPFGTAHAFGGSVTEIDDLCPGTSGSYSAHATDGSGYWLQIPPNG